MKCLTETATVLLMCENPPSDPLQAHPTPTPALWDSLRGVVTVQEFFAGLDITQTDFLSLRSRLMMMPYYMLAGHLPDLKLDVTNVMR